MPVKQAKPVEPEKVVDETTEAVLNLDDLFGQGNAIKVLWQERTYEFLRPEAFGAAETLRLAKLRRTIGDLHDAGGDAPEVADELEAHLDKLLTTLCTGFPVKEVPFPAKLYALNFYLGETRKNALMAALRQTGALPSAS